MLSILKLISSIFLCFAAGAVGSLFTVKEVRGWFQTLQKPPFAPPDWIFGPVWTVLYVLMGIAFYLIWMSDVPKPFRNFAMILFMAHLIFNALWSVLFFGMHSPAWAMVDIIVLWIMVMALIGVFWTISQIAGLLLVPYGCWVSFAMVLNYAFWRLN
jgi:tryptophan-rich sensory protein